MDSSAITALLVALLISGVVTGVIARFKNRSYYGWLAIGLLTGVIGIVVVSILPSAAPPPPRATLKEYCPRCNAVQNVPSADATYECWQCKQVNQVRTA